MEKLLQFIHNHAEHAHFTLFGLTLLAGLSVPISIDLLMIISATLAATVIPEHLYLLFFSMFIGCSISSWIAFSIGRLLGKKVLSSPFFSKILSSQRMDKIKRFYEKRGAMALFIGRFIPFGVRNALYMTSGMSHMKFSKFALLDGLACFIWSLFSFSLYYMLGKNIDILYSQVKWANLLIFIAFSVTVIGIIWYKKRKKVKENNV